MDCRGVGQVARGLQTHLRLHLSDFVQLYPFMSFPKNERKQTKKKTRVSNKIVTTSPAGRTPLAAALTPRASPWTIPPTCPPPRRPPLAPGSATAFGAGPTTAVAAAKTAMAAPALWLTYQRRPQRQPHQLDRRRTRSSWGSWSGTPGGLQAPVVAAAGCFGGRRKHVKVRYL